MIIKTIGLTVESIITKINKPKTESNRIEMDFSTQRYAGQWNLQKESELIRSMIIGDPIPPLFIRGKDNDLTVPRQVVDGKQRISTVMKFVSGIGRSAMKLHKDTKPVSIPIPYVDENGVKHSTTYVELAGKTFKQLPHDVQCLILEYNFDTRFISQCTQEDVDRIMVNLNNGVSPSGTDKAKMAAGQDVMNKVVNIIQDNPLFVEDINFKQSQIKKNAKEECVLCSLVQWTGKDEEIQYSKLQPKELEKIIRKYSGCWSSEIFAGLNEIFTTLHNALPDNTELWQDYLNKKHLPVLVMNVDNFLCKLDNGEITEEQYKKFLKKWFAEGVSSQEFNSFVVDDSKNISAKRNIEGRIALMDDALESFISTSELGLTAQVVENCSTENIISDSETNYIPEKSIENIKITFDVDTLTAYRAFYNATAEHAFLYSEKDYQEIFGLTTESDLFEAARRSNIVCRIIKNAGISKEELPSFFKVYQQAEMQQCEDMFEKWFDCWSNTSHNPYIVLLDEYDYTGTKQDLLTEYLYKDFMSFCDNRKPKQEAS